MTPSEEVVIAVNLLCQPNVTPDLTAFWAKSLLTEKLANRLSEEDQEFILTKLSRIDHPVWKSMIAAATVDFISGRNIRSFGPKDFRGIDGEPMTNKGIVYLQTIGKIEDALKEAGYKEI